MFKKTYATEIHTGETSITISAPLSKAQAKLWLEFRLFPATLSYAPLLSGFASEAAEGRRRSETHPTLQRNRLSTHPRGVRNVRTTVSTQHSLNAPQDNGVIAR